MALLTTEKRGKPARVGSALMFMMLIAGACAPPPKPAPPAPSAPPVSTQASSTPVASTPRRGGCEVLASERTNEIGCYLTAVESIGVLPAGPLFWHLDRYPSRAAAEAAKGPRGTVVESYGNVLLYTIAEEGWRATGGERLARIGPLMHETGKPYTARYMEGAFMPGMQTSVHRHSGAEAFYMLEGAQCLETPEGSSVMRAGESTLVRAGPPMALSHVGAEPRRSVVVVLVLHESSEPWISRDSDWRPEGRCPK